MYLAEELESCMRVETGGQNWIQQLKYARTHEHTRGLIASHVQTIERARK